MSMEVTLQEHVVARPLTLKDVNKRWGKDLSNFLSASGESIGKVLEQGEDWIPRQKNGTLPEFTVYKPKLNMLDRVEAKLGGVKIIGISFPDNDGFDVWCQLARNGSGYKAEIIKAFYPGPKTIQIPGSSVLIDTEKWAEKNVPAYLESIFTHWFQRP